MARSGRGDPTMMLEEADGLSPRRAVEVLRDVYVHPSNRW